MEFLLDLWRTRRRMEFSEEVYIQNQGLEQKKGWSTSEKKKKN